MKGIFDKGCNCVAWLETQTGMIFDKSMRWIGFVQKRHCFNKNAGWLGGVVNGTFVDKHGLPVAWIDGFEPQPTLPLIQPLVPLIPLTPLRPLQPNTPMRPVCPITPIGGWSRLDWDRFIQQ